MRIAEVNNLDLTGRIFNGHDLQLSLNALGHKACQFVLQKEGTAPTTIPLCGPDELFLRDMLKNMECCLGIANLIYPFGRKLSEQPLFKSADIVHYHLVHNSFISLLDFPRLARLVPSVWTVHDPWIVTGHCVHPLSCEGWKNGCRNCPNLDDEALPMKVDNAFQMWKIKKQVYEKLDIDIVVASQFMKEYITKSPLTSHFKHIHKISFGLDTEKFNHKKKSARSRWNIPDGSFVIAFRAEKNKLKGLKFIIEMLEKLEISRPVILLATGRLPLPKNITEKFRRIELGWQNNPDILLDFYAAADVFIMPSLAESFGLMAVEAMASGCPVIVFENTVLPEITFAPECGVAVPYKSSEGIKAAVERLVKSPDECHRRGELGRAIVKEHYSYKDYVRRHIELFHEILGRNKA